MVDARAGLPFTGTRVIELATGIAGPYCGKMLVDAGAEVVKIEPAAGDPLRAWTASGRELDGEDGVLFQYLNASKRSVVLDLEDPALAELWAGAHLVIESGQLSDEQILGLRDAHPHLGVVSITPWGRTGPCRDDASTEFTLQALCGSMAGRGTPDREPLHAGGRLGEWIAGVNGAVAAAALLLAQGRSGRGDHADVSHLEAMAVAMSGYASLRKSLLADAFSATRNVELPSIEPVGDGGYVGFCTITRQQFSDFLIMIGHGDLIDDDELASSAGRHGRQSEFLKMVHEWTAARTIEEIVDLATAFRIPVAPIGEPSTVMDFDQFVERGVYVANPGGFRQPRRPYLIDDRPAPSVGAAPELGRGAMPRWEAIAGPAGVGDDLPPLAGIRVVDLTAFWAGPSATQMLAALGADVIKVESIQRPDGMRFSGGRTGGDQWWEWGGMFHAVNMNKRGVTFDLGRPEGIDLVLRLVETADVVIENFSPRVMENFGLTRRRLQDANPKLIVCRMPAFGLTGPWRDRTGFAQTMEQASGMAWLTGFDDGPPILPHGPCDPIAGMHAAFAVIGCLHDVRGHGTGHFLECAMVESALNVAAELVLEHQAYGTELRRQATADRSRPRKGCTDAPGARSRGSPSPSRPMPNGVVWRR